MTTSILWYTHVPNTAAEPDFRTGKLPLVATRKHCDWFWSDWVMQPNVGIEAFNVSETKETLITTIPGEKVAR